MWFLSWLCCRLLYKRKRRSLKIGRDSRTRKFFVADCCGRIRME